MKELNLVKVTDGNSTHTDGNSTHYETLVISQGRWEHRLRFYMEDALVMLKVVQHQIVLKTLPGLAQSFGSILDAMQISEIVATVCGDDTCLIICEDHAQALTCYETLSHYTPPFFFSNK